MDKTAVVQLCLVLVAIYGIANVIQTELSGKGLYSMLEPTNHHIKPDDAPVTGAVDSKWPVIRLNVQKIRKRQNCFKYFTAENGDWIERCIQRNSSCEYPHLNR